MRPPKLNYTFKSLTKDLEEKGTKVRADGRDLVVITGNSLYLTGDIINSVYISPHSRDRVYVSVTFREDEEY